MVPQPSKAPTKTPLTITLKPLNWPSNCCVSTLRVKQKIKGVQKQAKIVYKLKQFRLGLKQDCYCHIIESWQNTK